MTDKQIIIDGCDVSECIYYADGKCTNSQMIQSNCKNVAVCYYKQLKRTEQECEELKEALKVKTDEYNKLTINYDAYVSMANEQLDKLKASNETLNQYKASKQASYEAIQAKCNELELKNRKLEAENEVLTWQRDEAQAHQYCLAYNNTCLKGNEKCIYSTCIFKSMLKIKQTLAEIKEICGIGIVNGLSEEQYLSELRDWQALILQKISECEVENG